jgi:hypothetical protein
MLHAFIVGTSLVVQEHLILRLLVLAPSKVYGSELNGVSYFDPNVRRARLGKNFELGRATLKLDGAFCSSPRVGSLLVMLPLLLCIRACTLIRECLAIWTLTARCVHIR